MFWMAETFIAFFFIIFSTNNIPHRQVDVGGKFPSLRKDSDVPEFFDCYVILLSVIVKISKLKPSQYSYYDGMNFKPPA